MATKSMIRSNSHMENSMNSYVEKACLATLGILVGLGFATGGLAWLQTSAPIPLRIVALLAHCTPILLIIRAMWPERPLGHR